MAAKVRRREHFEDGLDGTHLFFWRSCSRKSSKVKPSPDRALVANCSGLLAVELFFCVLEQGGDVAKAHDAANDVVGVEGLE
jgi:hypothetical protein